MGVPGCVLQLLSRLTTWLMPVASLAPDFQMLLRLSALTRASLAPSMMTSNKVISTYLRKEGMNVRVSPSQD